MKNYVLWVIDQKICLGRDFEAGCETRFVEVYERNLCKALLLAYGDLFHNTNRDLETTYKQGRSTIQKCSFVEARQKKLVNVI